LYPGMIERIPGSESGAVIAVDAATRRISTAFDDVAATVANIIPPQTASGLLIAAGLDDGLGWCPVDPLSFESRLAPDVYVLGDSALQGDMPKSAFSANMQAKACAAAILARWDGDDLQPAPLINVCYSLAAPGYGFSVADVFAPGPDKTTLMFDQARTTPLRAAPSFTRPKRNMHDHGTIPSPRKSMDERARPLPRRACRGAGPDAALN
ncbi:FCSD flavin-binding domain-containing protein, partial [Paracoccus sp. Z118]|uniref:FCSD flavin-binding domain-containing protein n=1 Tax=Paracoccus sp. Z118 TaxID=2851017 RepID=UPI0020B76F02